MLVFQDHHLLHLLLLEPNKSSELELSLSELNKSGSSVSTPNSFKSEIIFDQLDFHCFFLKKILHFH